MDNYEECIEYLSVLFAKPKQPEELKIQKMKNWIARIGITIDNIDSLNIIHVTGTKGKGSTCAFTEQILRNRGLKTGLYSSPHMIDVRERIKINGQLLSKEKFLGYFNTVYNNLHSNMVQAFDGNLPCFMTLMAFHTFLSEGVDVAIIEVGMGGLNDNTNIIRNPIACGVTSIGLDHMAYLGDTVEKIAKNKSGIFKASLHNFCTSITLLGTRESIQTSVPVFTSLQAPSVLQVLFETADELNCPIKIVPELDKYPNGQVELSMTGKVQQSNASLALQLARSWLKTMQHSDGGDVSECNSHSNNENSVTASTFAIHQSDIQALCQCTLPGRYQIINRPNVTYYFYGAHTEGSIVECVEWFKSHSKKAAITKSGKATKILIFNTALDRNAANFLSICKSCCFDAVVFCPNIDTKVPEKLNIYYGNIERRKQQQRSVRHNTSVWEKLVNQEYLIEEEQKNPRQIIHYSFPCVRQALCWASQGRNEDLPTSSNMPRFMDSVDNVEVLVTGNMHLVGAALGIVSPIC